MPGMLEDKVCLITGAGRGIGAAVATRFAEEGARVYANDNRPGTVDEWAAKAAFPGKVYPLYFDITDSSQSKEALMRIKKESGRLDVLVNNAGVEFNELIGMISEQNMRKMFEVNVFSMINLLQFAARIIARNSEGGSIINISSIVGQRGNRGQLVYSATKGAVISLTKSAAKELADKKIACARGSTNDVLATNTFPNAEILRYDSIADAFVAVKTGKADVLFEDDSQVYALCESNDDCMPMDVPLKNPAYACFGVEQGDTIWLNYVNRSIDNYMYSGTFKDMWRANFGREMADLLNY